MKKLLFRKSIFELLLNLTQSIIFTVFVIVNSMYYFCFLILSSLLPLFLIALLFILWLIFDFFLLFFTYLLSLLLFQHFLSLKSSSLLLHFMNDDINFFGPFWSSLSFHHLFSLLLEYYVLCFLLTLWNSFSLFPWK